MSFQKKRSDFDAEYFPSHSKRSTSNTKTPLVKHLFIFVAVCVTALTVVAVVGLLLVNGDDSSQALKTEIVELNGLAQEASSQDAQSQGTPSQATQSQTASSLTAQDAIDQAQDALRRASDAQNSNALFAIMALFITAAICLIALCMYLYYSVVRPFSKLQWFAEEVASGNFDLPLEYERSNPFGRFAWAFDHMRNELKRARANEVAAIEQNKTVIASLAHDLRTPVASMRTYAEALGMGLDTSEKERQEFAGVIEHKCIEVTQLLDDMLTHSLAELDRISVECADISAAVLLRQVVEESGLADIAVIHADAAIIYADELRLRQSLENLLVNASKYAPTSRVEVSGLLLDEKWYRITVRDFGSGMAPEDIPFAFDRFYRGANAQDIQGVGLGLFVVKHVIDRMNGCVTVANAHPGLSVCLDIPLGKDQIS